MEELISQRLQLRDEVSTMIRQVEKHLLYGSLSLVMLYSWNKTLLEKEQALKKLNGEVEDLIAIDKIAEEIKSAEAWANTIVTMKWKVQGVISDLRQSLKSSVQQRIKRNVDHLDVTSFTSYGSNGEGTSPDMSATSLMGITDEPYNKRSITDLRNDPELKSNQDSDIDYFANSTSLPSAPAETFQCRHPEFEAENDGDTQKRLIRTVSHVNVNEEAPTSNNVEELTLRAKIAHQKQCRTHPTGKGGKKRRGTNLPEESLQRSVFIILCGKRGNALQLAVKKMQRHTTRKPRKQRCTGRIPRRLRMSQRCQENLSRGDTTVFCGAHTAAYVPHFAWCNSTLRR
ncbi:hypothetical protein HPB48_023553 [Haemaphysalis longicornis]|uniref:Uncharacterized protein n=1 Tax=Haemaphysalis longicornis TaxID=44386 RepID=A0A9J6H5G8_HAELO|nr:hypothetical protein HPB48_023553 [Haemaphysalis longicornis]